MLGMFAQLKRDTMPRTADGSAVRRKGADRVRNRSPVDSVNTPTPDLTVGDGYGW